MAKREQISVHLDPQIKEFVEQSAAREDRSLAGQVRHLLAEAARQAGALAAGA